jgi:hypothetical protein
VLFSFSPPAVVSNFLKSAQVIQGPIFRTFFSAENHFPRKIPRNFLEKRFLKTFSAENSIFFPTFLGENFPRNFPQNFPQIFPRKKMYEKSAPGQTKVAKRSKQTLNFPAKYCIGEKSFGERAFGVKAVWGTDIEPHFWLLLPFLQKLPKVNNRPLDENSPNLVTVSKVNVMIAPFANFRQFFGEKNTFVS